MPIQFLCPGCERTLVLSPSAAGREYTCPSCRVGMVVPEPEVEEYEVVQPRREPRRSERPRPPKPPKPAPSKNPSIAADIVIGFGIIALVAGLIIVFVILPKPPAAVKGPDGWTHIDEAGFEFDLPGGPVDAKERTHTKSDKNGTLTSESITRTLGDLNFTVSTTQGHTYHTTDASRQHLENILKDVISAGGTASEITIGPRGHAKATYRQSSPQHRVVITVVAHSRSIQAIIHSDKPIDETNPGIQRFLGSFVVDY